MLVLDEERIETWERTREAMEKLAGKTLTEGRWTYFMLDFQSSSS